MWIQLLGADTCYQEVEDKVIGRKDRLWTHTERECCCISDTAVISVSCDYVCWLLRWDPPTVHLKSFFGELPYCPSASCLKWKSPYGFFVMHAHTKTSSFPKTHDELSKKMTKYDCRKQHLTIFVSSSSVTRQMALFTCTKRMRTSYASS